MTAKFGEGKPLFDIWMKEESDTIQHLAAAYCERVCFEAMQTLLATCPPTVKNIFSQISNLYALGIFKNYIGFFVTRELMGMDAVKLVDGEVNSAVKKLAPSALKIVNSFGIPEHMIRAPMAEDYVKYNEGTWHGEVPNAKL